MQVPLLLGVVLEDSLEEPADSSMTRKALKLTCLEVQLIQNMIWRYQIDGEAIDTHGFEIKINL